MDARLNLGDGPTGESKSDHADFSVCPPTSPLAMPIQPISADRVPAPYETDGRWRMGLILACALAVTAFAGKQMYHVLNASGMSTLEWFALVLFVMNFIWICSACGTVLAGFFLLLTQPRRAPAGAVVSASRTAIVFPIYNEDVNAVISGAEAVWDELAEARVAEGFEVFFLSDSTNAANALEEEAAMEALFRRRSGLPFFYRRRLKNTGRKAGNVADFVRRWGGRYDYMVVFDADSLMSAQALVELVRRMDASPRTALVQTLPVIVNARTTFARMQQFAMRSYGLIFGAGLAWWSGGSGNFWGHNAIIRVKAFAAHAGLPILPGKPPLGGPIMSHDFIEAALLRRAGWRVEIAPDIEGSYEQCPPTLIDMAIRDRRWSQGNMQHFGVLGARGLDWLSRSHIIAGIMGYMSAAFWFAMILTSLALGFQANLEQAASTSIVPDFDPAAGLPPDVLQENHHIAVDTAATAPEAAVLTSSNPPDDSHALQLFALTAAIVLSPKWLAIILWALGRLPGWSRSGRFVGGVLVETVLSALVAPIHMANQTAAVVGTLLGQDSGWRPQVRDRDQVDEDAMMMQFTPHTVLGIALIGGALFISPATAIWASPVALSLIFAGPLAARLARRVSPRSRLWGLTETPEEVRRPSVIVAAERAAERLDHPELDAAIPALEVSPPEVYAGPEATPEEPAAAAPAARHWILGAEDIKAPAAFAWLAEAGQRALHVAATESLAPPPEPAAEPRTP